MAECLGSGETLDETKGNATLLEPDETNFCNKTWRDDLALIVEDKPLYVNRCMLSYASPVFDVMFSSDFNEKEKEELTLPGKKYDDVVEFLQFIYPGMMKSVTLNNVFIVYPLAHEYQVQKLMSACEFCLIQHLSQNENPEYLYGTFEMACTFKLDQIKEKCIEIIAEQPQDEFEEKKSKFTFPDDLMNTIGTKLLLKLKTKYKDVFGHVKTSRALYQFLGRESKQKTLVEQHLNGQVVGDVVYLKVSSPTFEASSELCIGSNAFSLHVATWSSCYSKRHITVKVALQSNVQQDAIKGLCAVYILNWMTGKENKVKISDFQFKGKSCSFSNCQTISLTECETSLLSNEEAGFIYKGKIDVCIYLFCWRNI